MGEKHKVRFEPVDIEIEVDEEEEGYVLLCKSYAYGDLKVELIAYYEDMLETGVPIQMVHAEVEEIEPLTHDIKRLVLNLVDLPGMNFIPGQYAELYLPGSNDHRAYSMTNTTSSAERAEFIIKIYPGGRFSSYLDDELEVGDKMKVKVPFGMFMLREKSDGDIILVNSSGVLALSKTPAMSSMSRRFVRRYSQPSLVCSPSKAQTAIATVFHGSAPPFSWHMKSILPALRVRSPNSLGPVCLFA